MEYFKKFYREIVTVILLLMGIYLLILLTLISKDSYIKFNSFHLKNTDRYEFIGLDYAGHIIVLDKSTGTVDTKLKSAKTLR